MTEHIISLAPQTFVDLSAEQFVRVAAEAGYSDIGLRIIPTNPALNPPNMPCLIRSMTEARRVKAALDGAGVRAREMESIALSHELDLESCRPGLEIGAMLGAQYLLTTIGLEDFDESVDQVSAAGRLAAEYGMQVVIEFIPWRPVGPFDRACRIAMEETSGNVGVLIDALHFDRIGGQASDIVPYDQGLFPYVQICDAPAQRPDTHEELLRQAFGDRLYPGEGGLDLIGILEHLPRNIAISVEVPNQALVARIGHLAHAVKIRATTNDLIDRAAVGRADPSLFAN